MEPLAAGMSRFKKASGKERIPGQKSSSFRKAGPSASSGRSKSLR